MREQIAQAAINYDGKVWAVEVPGRHHTIARTRFETLGPDYHLEGRAIQGFVTTRGRFVDRKEAAQIAIESGQLEKLSWPPDLYSEDLW